MTAEPLCEGGSTSVSRVIRASRRAIFEACLTPDVLAAWRAPDGMRGVVHAFDAREGGTYRMSLTYLTTEHPVEGKTTEDTDTFEGRFVLLVPDETIVEVVRFESPDARFAGELRLSTTLTDAADGTEVTVLCENLPPGVRPEDNEEGTRQSLAKLARLLEAGPDRR